MAMAMAMAIAAATTTTESIADGHFILQGEQVVMEVEVQENEANKNPVTEQTEASNPGNNKATEKPSVSESLRRLLTGETLHTEHWVVLGLALLGVFH